MSCEPETPTVYIVEDEAEARDGLRFHLEAAGLAVRTYETAEAFLANHTPALTGCLITDVRLPGMDGVSLIETLIRRGNRLPIIVVSGYAETALVVEAMRAGAVDFLEKPLDPPALLQTLQVAMRGASTIASLLSEAAAAARRVGTLTLREREVFDAFAKGSTTKQVAETLNVSPKTIETHRIRLQAKLGVASPPALVRLGVLVALFGRV